MTLHCWTNGYDTVVAESLDDARAILRKLYGEDLDDDDCDGDGWDQYTDDHLLSILNEDGESKQIKTCGQWVQENGRGFLCSTEY